MPDITLVLYKPRMAELEETFDSLSDIKDEFGTLWILISGSQEDAQSVRRCLQISELGSKARLEHRLDNLGFASGHNRLLRRAFDGGASLSLVLNPDVTIRAGALTELTRIMAGTDGTNLFGPTLARHDPLARKSEVFDSAGIGWSHSGRHFDRAQGQPWSISPGRVEYVAGVTGACLFVPRLAFEKIVASTGHFFDDAFLAYREDAELGIRAGLVGVGSVLISVEGFAHVRSVRGYERGSEIADLLGVQNRYLIRWKLGRHRPGSVVAATARDIAVIAAVIIRERSSLPGLRRAFAIRRYQKYWGIRLRRSIREQRPMSHEGI